jgi:fucose permease
VLLLLSYVGFISLGLPDGVLGAAWPAIRQQMGLPLDGAGRILLFATSGTVLSSLLSGPLLSRIQTGAVLAGSALLAALALFLYAQAPGWSGLLAAALVAGFAGGAVDAALNGFVGRHYSVRHMNWLHGCWGVGATLGPLAVAVSLRLAGTPAAWRTAYSLLAVAELALAAAFLLSLRRWRESPPAPAAGVPAEPDARGFTPAMRANVVFFFLYSAVEAGAGLWIASLLIATRGASLPLASAVVSVYWGMLTAGRFLLGAVAERIGPVRLLASCCTTALVALLLLAVPGTPMPVAVVAIAVLGLALSPIYPLLMHDTPRRFGPAAARHMVGYQIAAASSAIAIFPWLVGLLARNTSPLLIPPALAALALVMVLIERGRRLARRDPAADRAATR